MKTSITTVILATTKEKALAAKPMERPGWKRQESLEDYDIPGSSACSKCGVIHLDHGKIVKAWRLSVTDVEN